MIARSLNLTAEKIQGQDIWHMGDGRYVCVDRGSQGRQVEVEFRRLRCGGVEVLDVREYPAH